MNIDWSKYKRFFAFGCSFTSYMWPTWADVASKEMPNAEFFNLGVSGSGNLLISLRVAEANTRFKFTDTDLIMVMFTTYTREDRYIDNKWVTAGNIFNNDIYPKDWVKKFCDERGYLIRDAALLENTTRYLESLSADSYCMLSVPFREGSNECDSPYEDVNNDIYILYSDTFSKFPLSMYELELKNIWEPDYRGFADGHPTTMRYYNYLEKLGFSLSKSTKQFALDATQILVESKSRAILPVMFPEQNNNISKACRLMF
jgi:hypothetical protein